MSNLLHKINHLSGIRSRRYVFVVIISLIVLVVSAYLSFQIKVNGDISKLAPENTPSVRTIREMEKRFGATNTLMVILVSPAGVELSKKLDKLAESLRLSPYVKRVDYRMDTTFFENHGLYFLTEKELLDLKEDIQKRIKEETAKSNPFYVDLEDEEKKSDVKAEPIDSSKVAGRFEGADYVKNGYFRKSVDGGRKEAWGLIVTPKKGSADMTYAESLVRDVKERIRESNMGKNVEVYLSGRYNYLAREAEQVFSDLRVISVVSTVAVLFAVFLFFPNIFSILLIFIPLILGLSIDFAIVKLGIGELNMVTSGTFSILFGIGVAYGVHVYARFREEKKLGHSYQDAMETSILESGGAIFGSASTTAVAFLSLAVARYRGFSHLGIITGLGVVFSFLTAMIVTPAIGKLLDRWDLLRKHRVKGTVGEDIIKGWGEPQPYALSIVIISFIVTLLSIYSISKLGYEMDYNKLTIEDPEREKARMYENALFGMSGEPVVTYAENENELWLLLKYLDNLKKGKGKEIIEKVVSIGSLIPEKQKEKQEIIKEIKKIIYDKKLDLAEGKEKESIDKLRRLTGATPFSINDIPQDVKSRFVGEDGGMLVYIYPKKDLTNLSEAMKMGKIVTEMEIGGRKISAANTTIIFASMQNLMLEDAPWVISLAFIMVLIFVFLTFKSVRHSILAIVPLVIGITWMLAFMKITNQKMNFFNIVAIPAVIGIGVDNGVHIVYRYRTEGLASLKRIVRNLGRTLLSATLTTVLGFCALLFAKHPGVKTLGAAAASGLFTTFLSAVFLLPSLIYILERIKVRKYLHTSKKFKIWSLAFDPVTEKISMGLREKNIPYTLITLDEIPYQERKKAVARLREKLGQEMFLPVIEKNGKFLSAGKFGMKANAESVGKFFEV